MAMDNRQLDPSQIGQLVTWLDEQRNQDRERINNLVKDLADMSTQVGEMEIRLRNQDLQLSSVAGQISKPVIPDAEVRPLFDQMSSHELKLESLEEELLRQDSLRNVNESQEKKADIETAQRLERIEQQLRTDGQKTAAIHAEISRERSLAATMPGSIEGLQRKIDTLSNRLIHMEDSDKRMEAATSQLESLIEENGSRVQQLENWSRLSDVRWSRQADEWSGRLEVWRAEDEERSRPVLAVSERVLSFQNQIDEVKAGTVELLERVGKLEVEGRTSVLEYSRVTERVQQLAAGQELSRQKLAEEASARWNVEESMHRAMGRLEEAQTLQKTMMSTLDRVTLELEQLERDKQALMSSRESDRILFQSELADLGGRLEQKLQNLQRDLMETRRKAAEGFRLVFEHRRQLNLSLEANLQDADKFGWRGTRSKSETLADVPFDTSESS